MSLVLVRATLRWRCPTCGRSMLYEVEPAGEAHAICACGLHVVLAEGVDGFDEFCAPEGPSVGGEKWGRPETDRTCYGAAGMIMADVGADA